MFDKTQIAALHAKLNAALDEFAKENGLVSGKAAIRYGSDEFKATVIFSSQDSNPDAIDPRYLVDLQRGGWRHGLTKEMVGKETVMPSRQGLIKFTFLGMRASKAVLRSSKDGKPYLFHADVAAKYLQGSV